MPLDTLRLILLSLKYILPYAFTALLDKCRALIHAQTYKPVPSPKNIIIAGASFAGIQVAQKLAHSIPSGYRVLLIARNEDFHYVFNFPRYAVLKGHERLGFIPYEGIVRGVPKGSLEVVRGSVVDIGENFVRLEGGESVEYAFLVVATGCAQSAPARLRARTREGACEELRGFQRAIEKAGRIAVVGGGAVGVELVADIKDYYPDKRVTLVHSRDQLLPRFGLKLHEYVVKALERLGVEVLLNERPESLPSNKIEDDGGTSTAQQSLLLKNGKIMDFDLVVCISAASPRTSLPFPSTNPTPFRSPAQALRPTPPSSPPSSPPQSPKPRAASPCIPPSRPPPLQRISSPSATSPTPPARKWLAQHSSRPPSCRRIFSP